MFVKMEKLEAIEMEIKITCSCGFVMENLVSTEYGPSKKMVERKCGQVSVSYCESGGVYGVQIECPKCNEKHEIELVYGIFGGGD